MQAQMLQTMQQTMVNLHAQPQAPPPPPRDSIGDLQRTKPSGLGDFQCTKSSAFSHVLLSMDADDWSKSIEKLQVV
jgi:hypothetical protein